MVTKNLPIAKSDKSSKTPLFVVLFLRGISVGLFVAFNAIVNRILNDERRFIKLLLFKTGTFNTFIGCMEFFTSFIAMFVIAELLRRLVVTKAAFKSFFNKSLIIYGVSEISVLSILLLYPLSFNVLFAIYTITFLQKFIYEYHASIFLQRLADLVLAPRLKSLATAEQSYSALKGKASFARQAFIFFFQGAFFSLFAKLKLPLSVFQLSSNLILFTLTKVAMYVAIANYAIGTNAEAASEKQLRVDYQASESLTGVMITTFTTGFRNSAKEILTCGVFTALTLVPKTYLKIIELTESLKGIASKTKKRRKCKKKNIE